MLTLLKPSLRFKIQPSNEIDDRCIREMHMFRSQFIRLKSEISVEHDFEKFSSFFKKGANAAHFRDRQGQLKGFFGYRIDRVTINGKVSPIIWMEYAFLDRKFRGHPTFSLVWLKLYCDLLGIKRSAKLTVFGITFPNSYLFGLAMAGKPNISSSVDPDLSNPRKAMLDFCIENYLQGDFDPETRLVTIRTIPDQAPWMVQKLKPHRLQALRDYEKLNSEWKLGIGLPTLFEITAFSVARASFGRMIGKRV